MSKISPIGKIKNTKKSKYPYYCTAEIEIDRQFMSGLTRLEEHSHLWVICLFEQQKEPALLIKPRHLYPTENQQPFGVFALRSPNHPNPLSLTLTKLEKIEDNRLYVSTIDANEDTPVLDIKPYYTDDIVFSPTSPTFQNKSPEIQLGWLEKAALNHHQEECVYSALAIRAVHYAELQGINTTAADLCVQVSGHPCFADTLQGLMQARLSNPCRFAFQEAEENRCRFYDAKNNLLFCAAALLPTDYQSVITADFADIFTLTWQNNRQNKL
ncbi:MAG: SAM-dependent methyltransferase [Bacillota bacterium]|jgi:tRNA-Thr(GGU) m(6)t(6)A37 methyltransferase TsaA